MNQSEPSSEVQSPIAIASFACLVCFVVIVLAARPVVVLVAVWWAELLVYALIPVMVSFIILYRSCWHPEITGVVRTCSLLMLSCAIFVGVLFAIGIMLCAACVFRLALITDMSP